MSAHLVTIFCASCAVAFAGFVLSSGKAERAARAALGIILVSAILSPLISLGQGFAQLPEYSGAEEESVFEKTAEEAFCDGVRLAIAERFSLDAEHISVRAKGFQTEKMTAEVLTVTLSERAKLADYRAIREFVVENNFGKCEVELR